MELLDGSNPDQSVHAIEARTVNWSKWDTFRAGPLGTCGRHFLLLASLGVLFLL